MLADAWERLRSERACSLFTILGDAGVGKSRLTAEFLAGLDATVVTRPLSLLRRGDHVLAGGRAS